MGKKEDEFRMVSGRHGDRMLLIVASTLFNLSSPRCAQLVNLF